MNRKVHNTTDICQVPNWDDVGDARMVKHCLLKDTGSVSYALLKLTIWAMDSKNSGGLPLKGWRYSPSAAHLVETAMFKPTT